MAALKREVLAEMESIRFDFLECWFSRIKQAFIGTTKILTLLYGSKISL